MKLLNWLITALALPISQVLAGTTERTPGPAASETRWSAEVQTAQLFGVNNPENYHLAAQYLSLGYRVVENPWTIAGLKIGPELLISAVGEAVLNGPENYYFGGALRGRLIFFCPSSKWSSYAEIGAGAGAIDSTGTRFGQGQDLTFNIIAGAGVRYAIAERCTVGLGIHYQHFSNAGLSEPEIRNTGLDAFGPSLTVGLAF